MFQPEVRHVVTKTEEEMIIAVMLRSKERSGLCNQILVVLPDIGWSIERGGAVCGYIHPNRGSLSRIQRNYFQILSGDDRAVDQHGQRYRLECDLPLSFQVIAGFPG